MFRKECPGNAGLPWPQQGNYPTACERILYRFSQTISFKHTIISSMKTLLYRTSCSRWRPRLRNDPFSHLHLTFFPVRRFSTVLLSFLISVLALVGGPNGPMVCFHQSGPVHLKSSLDCSQGCEGHQQDNEQNLLSDHTCEGCLDLEISGLDTRFAEV